MIGYLVHSHCLDPKIMTWNLGRVCVVSSETIQSDSIPIRSPSDSIGSSKDFQVSTPAPHCQWSWQRSPAPGSTLPIGGSRGPRCPHRGYIDSLAHLSTSIYFSKLSILGLWQFCLSHVYHWWKMWKCSFAMCFATFYHNVSSNRNYRVWFWKGTVCQPAMLSTYLNPPPQRAHAGKRLPSLDSRWQHMATTSHEEPKKSPTAEDIEPDFSEFQDLHFNLFEKIAEYWNSDTLHQAEPWNPERHSCQNRWWA